ncbi:DUF7351 domain-containing protein [Haladaptatus sp. NG-WS-4]
MAEETVERTGEEQLDSTDVFSLLGNETRMEITSVLHDGPVEPPVSFSTLYDHVDIGYTSKFNYHLGKLTPHFVSKGDDGYELTSAGRRLARAVAAGTYTEIPRLDPFDIDGACYACGEPSLSASYEDEIFTIECRDCREVVLKARVPPTVVRGRDPDDVVDAFEQWSTFQVRQAQRGICPDCGGPVDGSVTDDLSETIEFDAAVVFECAICGRRAITSFGAVAARHPTVRAFHRRRGEPLRDRRLWEIDQFIRGEHVDIRSRDPWLVRVSFYADGDACHVEIDETLEVVHDEIVSDDRPDN